MDAHDLTTLPLRMRALLMRRWRHVLVGVGSVAVLNIVLFEVLLHLPGGSGGGDGSSSMPSFVDLAVPITIAYLIVVAFVSLPMAVAVSALTEGDDDLPHGYLVAAAPAAVRHWTRLAVLLSPLLVLAIWAVHSLISVFSSALDSLASGSGGGGDPGEPIAFKVIEALTKFPVDWIIAIVLVGAWCMYSAVDAVRIQRGWLPGDPRPLVARHPLAVGVLAVVSTIVLGPVLRKALGSTLSSFFGSTSSATQSTGVMGVVLFSIVVSAFVSALAVAWVSLYGGEELDDPVAADGTEVPPGVAVEPGAGAADAPQQPQVVDLPQLLQPGATVGWWTHAPAGAAIGIGTWVGAGAPPRVAVADQAGAWSVTQAAPDGTQVFVSPADGWYYLAVASQEASAQQLHVRLILPPGCQLQQQAAG